jgi:hypothetical protein
LLQLRERRSGIVTKRETSRGQRRFAPVPLEESNADLFLESSYLKAQGRLAEMNQLRSTPEVQSLCHGEK